MGSRKIILKSILNKEQLKNYKSYFIDNEGNLCKRISKKEREKIEPLKKVIEDRLIKEAEERDTDIEEEKETIDKIQLIRNLGYTKIVLKFVLTPKKNFYYDIDNQGNIIEINQEEEEKAFIKRIKENKSKPLNEWDYDILIPFGKEYAGDFYDNFGIPKFALIYLLEALERKKEKPQPYVLKLIGGCYEKISNFEEAIKYYELSIKRHSQYKKFSSIPEHIEFCKKRLRENKKFVLNDWTNFIIKKREKKTDILGFSMKRIKE